MGFSSPEILLFDLDGVLVRTHEVWFRLLQDAGTRFRGRPVTREEFEPTFGQGTDADRRVFALHCTPAELNQFYHENFQKYAGEVWTHPEARSTLEELLKRGKKLGVVTNSAEPLATQILKNANLLGCFATVACADESAQPKPAPDLLHRALEALGVPPARAWMVGDSRYDRDAARAAAMFFVGLRTDGDLRIEHLRDLLQHVD